MEKFIGNIKQKYKSFEAQLAEQVRLWQGKCS